MRPSAPPTPPDTAAPVAGPILPTAACIPLNPHPSISPAQHSATGPAYPSRLPRDPTPLGPDGLPATRWTDPRVAADYANRDDDAERELVWPLLAQAVRPTAARRVPGRPDGLVLELGCGLGGLARRLADEHWLRVYAVDVSPTMHRLGAARFRDAWVVRTMPDARGRLPLRRAQCTGAIVQRVLLHLPHPCLVTGLLTEARRVLRPGAPLAIVESDTRAGERSRPDGEAYAEHYRLRDGATLATTAWRHSPEIIVDCLADAGFDVEEIQQLSVPVPVSLSVSASGCGPEAETGALLLYRAKAV